MDIKDLQQKTMELRKQFKKLQIKDNGRPWTSVEMMAGFMADVGQLSKLIMAKEGLRKDFEVSNKKLSHELADCFWNVLVLADKYNVDLEKSLLDMCRKDSQKINDLLNQNSLE